MRRFIPLIMLGALASAVLVTTTVPARAEVARQQSAGEIGVTKSEIHIAVVADVDSPLSPGLFQGVVDGVRGAAKYLNSKGAGGGIAGRKLVVDFLDSKLNPTASRNDVITACAQDFALVGTAAIFLTNFDDAVACKDQAGVATGLPDFAAVAGSTEGCTPISYPVNPPNVFCDTMTKSPQTHQTNQGLFTYLQKQHKQGLHGALVYSTDTKAGSIASRVLLEGPQHAGVKPDQLTGISARATQTEYTPIIQKMKADGSNFAYNVTSSCGTVALMSEAQLQGLTDPNIAWTCTTACYDTTVSTNAAVTNNLYRYMTFLPFEEASTNAMLSNFVKYVGADKVSGFGVYGWTSTLAFAQVAKAAVVKSGANGLTRASLLEGATLTAFDADGMIGKTNIARRSRRRASRSCSSATASGCVSHRPRRAPSTARRRTTSSSRLTTPTKSRRHGDRVFLG